MSAADGDFLFQFPAYIVQRIDGKVFGYISGNVNGLPIYTDRASAIRAIGSTPRLSPFEYATSADLLEYLRSLPVAISHVVLDPMDAKRAGLVKLKVFIDTLAAAGCRK